MTQNLHVINYEAVVAELRKGLYALDSEVALCCSTTRSRALAEFRTIGLTACRQRGKTKWMVDSAIKDVEKTLVVFPNSEYAENFKSMWLNKWGETRPLPTIWYGPLYPADDRRGMSPYLEDLNQFSEVYIDDSNYYFSRWRHGKTYRALDKLCSDDVVITLIG